MTPSLSYMSSLGWLLSVCISVTASAQILQLRTVLADPFLVVQGHTLQEGTLDGVYLLPPPEGVVVSGADLLNAALRAQVVVDDLYAYDVGTGTVFDKRTSSFDFSELSRRSCYAKVFVPSSGLFIPFDEFSEGQSFGEVLKIGGVLAYFSELPAAPCLLSGNGGGENGIRPRLDDATTVTDNGVTNDSPALFPLGSTAVAWAATDASGNGAIATQTVVVTDGTPPVLEPVSDLVAEASSPTGAMVTFSLPKATDLVDPSPAVVAAPNSGSTFPFGETVVTVTATDAAGNSSQSAFAIRVEDTTPPRIVPALNVKSPSETENDSGDGRLRAPFFG